MSKKKINSPLITKNKKAYFDYEILDSWEAWIELVWHETKSIREWYVNLKWSYISYISWELYVKSMHISLWKSLPNKSSLETNIERKIFLHKKTITFLSGKLKQAGYSIIPLELYFKWSLIKLRVWLAKWKKAHQKKQVLKERTMDKESKMMMKKFI
jgi:SsrA-binding protein